MNDTELVKQIYDDFMRGEVAALLAKLDPDVEFRLAEGHPYQPSGRAWVGKDAVTERFFKVAGSEWDRWTITVKELIATADAVIVEGRYSGTYKPTGRAMNVQVCHVWRLRGGRVTSFHQYLDTASLQRVMGREP